jgi:nucleotide-binding universal stress UspA family protein
MQTLLIPLDGSRLAEQILPYARMLAACTGMQLRLMHVIPEICPHEDLILRESLQAMADTESPLKIEIAHRREILDGMRRRYNAYLEPLAAQLQAGGIDTVADIEFGPVGELIVEQAAGPDIGMVAMVTHGRSGLTRWALGSNTDRVVQATDKPILIIRGMAQPPADVAPPQRILVPLDGSAMANQVLPLALKLAAQLQSELLLLRVVPPTMVIPPELRFGPLSGTARDITNDLFERAQSELHDLGLRIQQPGVHIKTHTVIGQAAESILDESERQQAGLIIMATHGYSGLRRWALGSTTERVLHAARIPLILVRSRG